MLITSIYVVLIGDYLTVQCTEEIKELLIVGRQLKQIADVFETAEKEISKEQKPAKYQTFGKKHLILHKEPGVSIA